MPDTWDEIVDVAILGPEMDVFGRTVTYTFKAGGCCIITGVFDEQFLSMALLGDGPFPSQGALSIGAPGSLSTAKPVLGVQLSQFPQPPLQGDRLTVQPSQGLMLAFVVKNVQPDGHGHALLTLQLDV